MKMTQMNPEKPATSQSCSVNFRAENVATLWTTHNQGYLWWIHSHQNEAQYFQVKPSKTNILKSFTNNLLEFDTEYTVGVGVYDTAGGAVKWVLYIDDFNTPVYEYTFAEDEVSDTLNGESGYFMLGSGEGVNFTVYPVEPADMTELKKAIENAEATLANANVGTAYGEYSESVIAKLEKSVDDAKELAESTTAIQYTVDKTTEALNKAVANLKYEANTKMEVTENGEATINYDLPEAEFNVTNAGVTKFTLNMNPDEEQPVYKFTFEGADGTVTTDIAKGATLSADGWSGDFKLPVLGTTPSKDLTGTNYTVLSMGSEGKVINSSEIVRIVLPGQAGKSLAYLDGTSYKMISKNKNLSEDSFEAAAKELSKGGVAKVNSGDDMVIYTTYLTEFVAYDWKASSPTPTPSTTPVVTVPGGSGTGVSTIAGTTGSSTKPDTTTKSKFVDIIGHWAETDINDMADKGIVSGVTATTFEPDRSITRAEFAALMTRALKLSAANDDAVFADVSSDAWYADEVAAAAAAGLVVGYDGKFRPEDTITREEMAVVIMKAYAFLGKSPLSGQLDKFVDKDAISDWAVSYVDQAVSSGLISGMTSNTFAPAENATRAQVTSLIKRLLNS